MGQANGGAPARLSDNQRIAWLRLIRTPNVGPASFRALIGRFGSAQAAIDSLPEMMRSSGSKRPARIPSIADVEAEMEHARKCGARFIAIGEHDYPALLKQMDMAPPLLAVMGDASIFQRPAVAMVGARNASIAGMKFARRIAEDLGRSGHAVVSGLARGVDTAAHEGALKTGTVAAVAGGLDRPYPPQNADLMTAIAEYGGAVVSEMPFGWAPRAQDFPRRNRLIAGLSIGLLVVEAARRSGSLISARLAGEMGRIVFAVPGSPLDPRSEGTNKLLKDGAILVTGVDDVIETIAPLIDRPATSLARLDEPVELDRALPPADNDRARVTEALGATPVSIDDLVHHTGLHPSEISLILLELDLAGKLERHSGGAVSLILTVD